MRESNGQGKTSRTDIYVRALAARDARFDGVFFVGISTTKIYCRPICPARVSHPSHRTFFDSAAAAEHAGFRPCRRCRPELAPGRALINAVSRLAYAAAHRIAAGDLNGRRVSELAGDLGVSERHLRRALKRELGVSPVQLAQTHRLLLAKHLLTDTTLPVIRVAYASGFESLRRFNAVFRERYRMSPSDLRRKRRRRKRTPAEPGDDLLRLTLGYRPPYAWQAILELIGRDLTSGVEVIDGSRYGRSVRLGDHSGVVFVEDGGGSHLNVHVTPSLLPALMPLIARLRHLFDLDSDPAVVDPCLESGGLGPLVRQRPGLRIPGAFNGFELGLRLLLGGRATNPLAARLARVLGEPLDAPVSGIRCHAPRAKDIARAGADGLAALGVPKGTARTIAAFARAAASGSLRLEAGSDATAAYRALMAIDGVGDRVATILVMRALSWPDAFPESDPALERGAGVPDSRELHGRAEAWRPWRSYAALHLWLSDMRRDDH